MVTACSFNQRDKLTDKLGFSYGVKKWNASSTIWRCSIFNKQLVCHATVHQEGDVFTWGPQPHLHPGQPGIANSLQSRNQINANAVADILSSAAKITEKALAETITDKKTTDAPSANSQLAQNANHLCQCLHTKDPKDLYFNLVEDFLPEGIFCKDITVENCCHILFATDRWLTFFYMLNWFFDATLIIVKHPFIQLLSIHAFIRSEDCLKQVPLFVCGDIREAQEGICKCLMLSKVYSQHCCQDSNCWLWGSYVCCTFLCFTWCYHSRMILSQGSGSLEKGTGAWITCCLQQWWQDLHRPSRESSNWTSPRNHQIYFFYLGSTAMFSP